MTESRNEPALEAKLRRLRLRFELPDQETLSVKRVPTSHCCFNKATTNLLIKKCAIEGARCVVCVDDDLDYLGADKALAQAFAAGATQQGWRILMLGGSLRGDLSSALDYALEILGADAEPGKEPGGASRELAPPGRRLLATWAKNLSKEVVAGTAFTTLFRDEAIEQVVACALSWQGRTPLILGRSGAGKTNLLHGVAHLLSGQRKEVLVVNMGAMMAGTLFESEREVLLVSLLREARDSGIVLAMEQAEWAMMGVPRGHVLLREALDDGARLIATSTADHEQRFQRNPLGSRLEIVHLGELCASDTCRVLEALRPPMVGHHGVRITEEVVRITVERSLSMDGSLPGKAIKLLDAAAARSRLTGATCVTELDVYIAASRMMVESA